MESRKSRCKMGSEQGQQQGWGVRHRRRHPDKPKEKEKERDVYAELSQAGYETAHVLAVKQKMGQLRDRLAALERRAEEERVRHNKLVLRELVKLVKEARVRIVEANGIPAPTSKKTWRFCLQELSVAQLERAHVNVQLWPKLMEILSPSTAKLNDWVHGYTTWQTARVIEGMGQDMQAAWAALFQVMHRGQSFLEFATAKEPSVVDELQDME